MDAPVITQLCHPCDSEVSLTVWCYPPQISLDGGCQLSFPSGALQLLLEDSSSSCCLMLRKQDWTCKCSWMLSNKPPLVLCIWRMWWLHVETGRPNDWDTLLFHCPHLLVSLLLLSECVRVQWQPASHCPIIPAALTLRILWGFLLMSKRLREKKRVKMERNEKRGELKKVWAEQRIGVKVQKVNRSEQSCVCVCVLTHVPALNSPSGSSLSAGHCAGKGVSFWIWMFASVTMESDVIVIL